jgi:hypothetical protein
MEGGREEGRKEGRKELGVVIHAYYPIYTGGEYGRILVQGQPRQKC